MQINFELNHEKKNIDLEPNRLLVDVLRDEFNLTSVRKGCNAGECGSCTVILDGRPAPSCMILISQVHNSKIITTEGLEKTGDLDIFQKTFSENGAIQCGYCTPGMILSAKALLMRNKSPGEPEVRRAISGNLCRCTGYNNIVRAIMEIGEKYDAN